MVGFVAAVFAELTTQQSVWSQIAGKTTASGKVLEHGWQFAPLGFGAVVALLTYASIAPQFQAGLPSLVQVVPRFIVQSFRGCQA